MLRDLQRVTGKRERVFHKVSYQRAGVLAAPGAAMKMGTESWKLQDLRRTCATNLRELGIPGSGKPRRT